ncbi:MAG: ankyrin repeat domain-containing protein [Cyanobium sp. MAG06]|nr:ankyrin repeat domain-containing protein [Cyanobium sp. MAG06]
MTQFIKILFIVFISFGNTILFSYSQNNTSTSDAANTSYSSSTSLNTAVNIGDNNSNNIASATAEEIASVNIIPSRNDFGVNVIKVDSCAYISKDLLYRAKDTAKIKNVAELQKFLVATDYLDKNTNYIPGTFDEETLVALLDFQKEHNLKKEYKLSYTARNIINTLSCEYRFAYLLNRGARFNTVDKDGESPLMYAARSGQSSIADILVRAGADVNIINKDGMNALMFAVINNMGTTSRLLINSGTNLNHIAISKKNDATNTAFSIAMEYQRYDIAKYIISRGYDINIKTGKGLTAANLAVIFGQADILEQTIKSNADVSLSDDNKATPLLYAVFSNNATTVRTILKSITSNEAIDIQDDKGKTPLMYALDNKNIDIFNMLIKKNPDLNIRDVEGRTSLIYSIGAGLPKIARILINKGADINLSDIDGRTPLMYSILYNQPDIYDLISVKLKKVELPKASSTATTTTTTILNTTKYASTSADYIPVTVPAWKSVVATSTFVLATSTVNSNLYNRGSTSTIYIMPTGAINNTRFTPAPIIKI